MQTCPCCRARLHGGADCPRCRADLSLPLAARQGAAFWLARSLDHWRQERPAAALAAIEHALRLRHTPLASALQKFMLERQVRLILALLANRQILPAKRRLYALRRFFRRARLLRVLDAYVDYLMVNKL